MNIGASVNPRGEIVEQIERLPEILEFVELPLGELERNIEEVDKEALLEVLNEKELDLIVHLPFAQPIVTQVEEFNQAEIDYLGRLTEFSERLGAEKVVLHPSIRYREEQKDVENDFKQQLEKINEMCENLGLELCVENMPPQINCAANNEDLAKILRELNISMCFDTGHGYASMGQEDMEEFLEENSDIISHLHLQDSREGEDLHLPVGSAEIDFEKIGNILSEFEGTATMEVFIEDMDYLRLSEKKVREYFNQ